MQFAPSHSESVDIVRVPPVCRSFNTLDDFLITNYILTSTTLISHPARFCPAAFAEDPIITVTWNSDDRKAAPSFELVVRRHVSRSLLYCLYIVRRRGVVCMPLRHN